MTQQVITITYTTPFEWYQIGESYMVIYDPYVNQFLAIDNGGAGRYIDPTYCQEQVNE